MVVEENVVYIIIKRLGRKAIYIHRTALLGRLWDGMKVERASERAYSVSGGALYGDIVTVQQERRGSSKTMADHVCIPYSGIVILASSPVGVSLLPLTSLIVSRMVRDSLHLQLLFLVVPLHTRPSMPRAGYGILGV